MPLQPGEVSLVTLFADVHTYLAPPASKPVHHRFDRRSYLYLYHDALNKRGRIEIANNAGTPDQDALSGYLDMSRVEYSYSQPNLFTVTANNQGPNSGSPQNDLSQWHIPAYDPRNENKYMYKIHTIDIYLWTTDDASLLLDSLKRVLQPAQLAITGAPPHSEHRDSMSPVVQQLEKVAVSNQPRRNDSISTTQSFAPPPPNNSTPQPQSPPPTQQTFAPMAYNPAAPAAPEQRAHREKTPPPPDADSGTGLTAAVHDHPGHFGATPQGGFGPQQTGSYLPGPPQRTSPLPPPPQSPFQQSFGPQQTSSAPDPNAHLYAQQPGTPGLNRQSGYPYSSGPTTQYASYSSTSAPGGPGSPGLPHTPGYAPLQSPGFAPQGTSSGYGPQTTTGHSSAYSYNPSQTTHGLHQQLYVPEGSDKPAEAGPGAGAPGKGKFDQKVDKLEKGVGKFLKKLDSKW